jgi:hypothetical protein
MKGSGFALGFALVATVTSSLVFAQTSLLLAARDFSVGVTPQSVAVGDFNGDGILDVAVANPSMVQPPVGPGNVSILLGRGDGTFQPAVNYPADQNPYFVAVGDFNHDGKLDLAVVNQGFNSTAQAYFLSILLGNGDGTFQSPVNYSLPPGAENAVAVADLNGDGKPDLAVITDGSTDDTVSIFLGNGDGSFQSPVAYSYPSAGADFIAAADFNHDHNLDLAVTNSTGTVSIFLNQGKGTFAAPTSYPAGINPKSLAVGDLNADGNPDLVVAGGYQGSLKVLLGNANGTFRSATNLPTTNGTSPQSVVIADFNHDGHPDLAFSGDASSLISVLYGNGDGSFTQGPDYAVGLQPQFMAFGDFNNDGNPDLVVADRGVFLGSSLDGTISVLLGKKDGTFKGAAIDPLIASGVGIAVADFDDDNNLDLALITGAGNTVVIMNGAGNGTFSQGLKFKVEAPPAAIASGDLNGDGLPDLVTADVLSGGGGAVSVLLNAGDGSFQSAVNYVVGNQPAAIAVADFNNDGKLDVVALNENCVTLDSCAAGSISILLGEGNGVLQKAVQDSIGTMLGPYTMAVADLNHDGNLDLVIADGNCETSCDPGRVEVLLGNGDGTFQSPVFYNAPNATPGAVAIADFNGDGIPDIAFSSMQLNGSSQSQISVLLGKGDGTFHFGSTMPIPGYVYAMAAADMNGDGNPDLLTTGDSLQVFLSTGKGTFKAPQSYDAAAGPLAIADFNGDGRPDVAIASFDNLTLMLHSASAP